MSLGFALVAFLDSCSFCYFHLYSFTHPFISCTLGPMLGAGRRVEQTPPPSVVTTSALETCLCLHFSTSHASPKATCVCSLKDLCSSTCTAKTACLLHFPCPSPLLPTLISSSLGLRTENKKAGPGMILFPISEGLFLLPPSPLEWSMPHSGMAMP